ncbi:hypothetical protein SS50377_26560 [Spironucleus salmonicida]|uniref:Uncharacterized protein n=1 Tax=Spironucleus salmonicida TaxID=348837 RepID=V6LL57_9EUKA|nr:hypothetical protein SS50377_26560 [Spironucleus salmonicida]|eukprot:EST41414.1 Hypothetical protein SS50377_19131 [Spironucleus salmonicida]
MNMNIYEEIAITNRLISKELILAIQSISMESLPCHQELEESLFNHLEPQQKIFFNSLPYSSQVILDIEISIINHQTFPVDNILLESLSCKNIRECSYLDFHKLPYSQEIMQDLQQNIGEIQPVDNVLKAQFFQYLPFDAEIICSLKTEQKPKQSSQTQLFAVQAAPVQESFDDEELDFDQLPNNLQLICQLKSLFKSNNSYDKMYSTLSSFASDELIQTIKKPNPKQILNFNAPVSSLLISQIKIRDYMNIQDLPISEILVTDLYSNSKNMLLQLNQVVASQISQIDPPFSQQLIDSIKEIVDQDSRILLAIQRLISQ